MNETPECGSPLWIRHEAQQILKDLEAPDYEMTPETKGRLARLMRILAPKGKVNSNPRFYHVLGFMEGYGERYGLSPQQVVRLIHHLDWTGRHVLNWPESVCIRIRDIYMRLLFDASHNPAETLRDWAAKSDQDLIDDCIAFWAGLGMHDIAETYFNHHNIRWSQHISASNTAEAKRLKNKKMGRMGAKIQASNPKYTDHARARDLRDKLIDEATKVSSENVRIPSLRTIERAIKAYKILLDSR